MTASRSSVRFEESQGRLGAVRVRRSSRRPAVSALHHALLALGVVVTSYQAQALASGLEERLELSTVDGHELDDSLSLSAKSAIMPLALDMD